MSRTDETLGIDNRADKPPSRLRARVPPFALGLIGLALAVLAQAPVAMAQSAWPTRPVRLILPAGAGSGLDVTARLLVDRLSARWGEPVVIDNRPGGDGMVGMASFLNANDDHTLFFAAVGTYTVHPYQVERLNYDFSRDVKPIARIVNTVLAASAPASSATKSLEDFVALARANPGKLNAAMPQGISELVFDGFLKTENLDIQKVPYKDFVQAVPDLVTGRLNFLFTAYAVVRPVVQGGSVRVLAVGSRERFSTLPDVPTVIEAGAPSLQLEGLAGLFGPAKMPLDLRNRLGREVVEAMKDKTLVDRLDAAGQPPAPGGAAELQDAVQQQIDQVDRIAKLLGMRKKS